tara:strand:+ start:8522 stop:9595 length:1074 start_codon:yes stop_codon:yes gene_type:complete
MFEDMMVMYERGKQEISNIWDSIDSVQMAAQASDAIKTAMGVPENANMVKAIEESRARNTPVEIEAGLFQDTADNLGTQGLTAEAVEISPLDAQGFTPERRPDSLTSEGIKLERRPDSLTSEDASPRYIENALKAFGGLEGLNHGSDGKLVNGRRTYNYGVEEDTLTDLGIERTDYANEEGVVDDLAVAKEVGKSFHKAVSSKIPSWKKMPKEVYDVALSLTWNAGKSAFKKYNLGKNLDTIAKSDDTQEVKKGKYATELLNNLLDVVGAKIKKADGTVGSYVQAGLANRRGRDYNLAAEALGADKITEYRVSKEGTGTKIDYFTEEGGDTPIKTVTSTKAIVPTETSKLGIKYDVG